MKRSTVRSTIAVAITALLALASTAGPTEAAFPGKNGRIVVEADLGKGFELYLLAGDGSTYRRLTFFKAADPFGMAPSWSPDAETIVFDALADSGHYAIWTIRPDGSGLTQLTHGDAVEDVVPNYSFDGAKIVFVRATATSGAFWTMDADGKNAHKLGGDVSGYCPVFAPDGHIYYDSNQRGFIAAIWVMNADGSGRHRLTKPNLKAGCPEMSPDGSKIVFSDNQNGPNPASIWMMNSDGTGVTQITHQKFHHDLGANFSPDGKKLVFASDRNYLNNLGTDLFEMNTNGSHIVQITTDLTPNCENPGSCAVPPDWGPQP